MSGGVCASVKTRSERTAVVLDRVTATPTLPSLAKSWKMHSTLRFFDFYCVPEICGGAWKRQIKRKKKKLRKKKTSEWIIYVTVKTWNKAKRIPMDIYIYIYVTHSFPTCIARRSMLRGTSIPLTRSPSIASKGNTPDFLIQTKYLRGTRLSRRSVKDDKLGNVIMWFQNILFFFF